MIIDTSVVLKTTTNDPYKQGDKDLTLGLAVGQVLATLKSGDPLKSFVLAQKFATQPEVEVTSDDIVFIKDKLTQSDYFPYIVGQIISLLEGNAIQK